MSEVDAKTARKWVELAVLLDRLTEKNKIKWSEGAKQNSFVTSVGDKVVSIFPTRRRLRGQDDVPVVRVEIEVPPGDVTDGFDDEDINSYADFDSYHFMLNLHRQIERRVSGADEVLDDILQELKASDDDITF